MGSSETAAATVEAVLPDTKMDAGPTATYDLLLNPTADEEDYPAGTAGRAAALGL